MIKYIYCLLTIGLVFSSCKERPESGLTIKYSLNSNWISQIDTIIIDKKADSLRLLFDIVENSKTYRTIPIERAFSDYGNLKYVKAGTYKYTFQNGIKIELTNTSILPHRSNYFLSAYKNEKLIWGKKISFGFKYVLFGTTDIDYLYFVDYAGRLNAINLESGKLKYLVEIDDGFSYDQEEKAVKYGDYILLYGNNSVVNKDLYGDYAFHNNQEKIYIIELNE